MAFWRLSIVAVVGIVKVRSLVPRHTLRTTSSSASTTPSYCYKKLVVPFAAWSNEWAVLPDLVVLDLDDCVWHPEMFTLDEMPGQPVIGDLNGRGEGVIGVRSGTETITMFPGALQALQECAEGRFDPMRLAVASSADTQFATQIAQAALRMLEVLPGVTLRQLLARGWPDAFEGNVWIGRQMPLSSDKSRTHFPLLKEVCHALIRRVA